MPATASRTRPLRQPPAPAVPKGAAGEQARERLLLAALRLFADQGFARTSTREIAQAAGANVAAIRYYFGDKEGLYRAAYTEPMHRTRNDLSVYEQPGLDMHAAFVLFIGSFLEPMKLGDELLDQSMRLRYREMLEPSALWQEEVEQGIRPAHQALVRLLCRHLGLQHEDDEVHRLAFAIVALPMHLYVCRDLVERFRPALLDGEDAVQAATERLADYALGMVDAEARRRAALKKRRTQE
ncbi:CerR family C-terminal domain-containing protein [Ramlibacter henchirensis]|nr:CerR family C-terminal domain-containing protein [Ramlibacter henchirensis]